MQSVHRLISAAALALLSASAFASTTVYTSSASFLSNVAAGAYTNDFNGLTEDPPTAYSSGGFSYTASAGALGLYSSGSFLSTSQIDQALTIDFTGSSVFALGANFFAVNLADAFQSVAINLTLSDGTTVAFTPSSQSDSYRGFVSTLAITSLVISGPGQSLYASLDNLTVGAAVPAVPEPTTWALMGLGLAGIAVAARRKA